MKLLWLFIAAGGIIGGFVPEIFGAGGLSLWSIVASGIGSVAGIYFYKKLDLDV